MLLQIADVTPSFTRRIMRCRRSAGKETVLQEVFTSGIRASGSDNSGIMNASW
jgi:hypothetical protein